jgi:hypothetical protein
MIEYSGNREGEKNKRPLLRRTGVGAALNKIDQRKNRWLVITNSDLIKKRKGKNGG